MQSTFSADDVWFRVNLRRATEQAAGPKQKHNENIRSPIGRLRFETTVNFNQTIEQMKNYKQKKCHEQIYLCHK